MNNGHTNYDENLVQQPTRTSLYLIQLALSKVFPPESSPYWVTVAIDYSGVSKALQFSYPLSRMPWKYYGEVIGALSQKNSE